MDKKQQLLVICGPTGTGKTALGIKLAKKFNGEIVSADSRQVYKGMDIGTGKDFQIFKTNNIKVWLYDLVKPDYQFSVADYVKCANLVIEDIYKRGKLPIIVGGTGLYIKGVIDGIETMGVPPDWNLRRRLLNCSIVELLDKLKKLNPQKWQSMNHSDRNNPRRLIRAIEIAREKKKNPVILVSEAHPESGFWTSQNDDNLLMIGLTADYEILYQRIDGRVEERIKQGMAEEIEKLLEMGYNFENSAMRRTIGYREWREYFCHPEFISGSDSGKARMTKEMLKQVQHDSFINIIQCWKLAEHAYARRQMTWFKKDKRINWFDIEKRDWRQAVEEEVGKWYNDNYSSSKARSPKNSSRLCLEQ